MSGDVQPRKRKDKKRKREEDESSHGVHITKMAGDDVHLHIQEDHDTGGHWCAKLLFFFLLTILLGLIGLILLENRGLSNLDTPLSESRFSNYFDGWVDEHRKDHEEHDAVQASIEEHDEHDEPFEEVDDHSENDEEDEEEEHDDNHDEEDDQEEEEEEEEEEAEEDEKSHHYRSAPEDDDEDEEHNDNNDDDDDENATEEATREETAEDNVTEENNENDDNDDDNDEDDEDNNASHDNVEENDDDDEGATTEKSQEDGNGNNEDDDDAGDEDDAGDDDDGEEELIKPLNSRPTHQTPKSQEADDNDDNDPFDEDDDDDGTFESFEPVDNDAEELLLLQEKARKQAAESAKNAPPADPTEDEEDEAKEAPSWGSSLAVKVGVGVALASVARLVLFRKNPDSNYSEEEIEIEEEIEEEIEIDENGEEIKIIGHYAPETFEQLNSLYKPKGYDPKLSPHPPRKNEIDVRFERSINKANLNTSTSTQASKKNPAIFNAPPPPPLVEAKIHDQPTFAITAPTPAPEKFTTGNMLFAAIPPTPKPPERDAQKEIPETSTASTSEIPTTTKRTVTHDVDYQPDDDDIDYDSDEDYDEEDDDEEDDDDLDDDDVDGDLDDVSDVDDADLMDRLEAKYGRLPVKEEFESDEDPEDPTWTQIKLKESRGGGPEINDDDSDLFEEELRRANEEMTRENFHAALQTLTLLSLKYPDKPTAFLGKAKSLDHLAEQRRSNKLLGEALEAYKRYLAFDDLIKNDAEYRAAAERCIERMRFLDLNAQTLPIHEQMIKRFESEPDPRNQLAVTYLLLNRLSDAKKVLQKTLSHWPSDGFAQVHYGFVLKQLDNNLDEAVIYLQKGIQSNATGTQDGRFYFHLGDALQRLGRQTDALEIYKRGAALKLFPSIYQRSLYNEPQVKAQPFWTKHETTYATYLNQLEQNWRTIRDEALSVLNQRGYFVDEAENLRDSGEWQQFTLYSRGERWKRNCQKAPVTCGIIAKFNAASGCRRGQVKFSVMHPGTHVWPHCGPTNCRLRAHLGLVVPAGTHLRVADKNKTWTEGKFLIFDDSFEHEVWHNGTSLRLVLIVDVWHPDLSEAQRQSLPPI